MKVLLFIGYVLGFIVLTIYSVSMGIDRFQLADGLLDKIINGTFSILMTAIMYSLYAILFVHYKEIKADDKT